MEFVARGIAVEFGQPPFTPVRGRRAVLAAAMPVPKAAMDEDGGFVFGEKDVHRDRSGRAALLRRQFGAKQQLRPTAHPPGRLRTRIARPSNVSLCASASLR